jgi:hypothetical protein
MRNLQVLLWTSLLTLCLTTSPAQAGEAKRKSLTAIRKAIRPIRWVTSLLFLGSTLIDERLEREIQRDKDKEFNEAAVKQSQAEVNNDP